MHALIWAARSPVYAGVLLRARPLSAVVRARRAAALPPLDDEPGIVARGLNSCDPTSVGAICFFTTIADAAAAVRFPGDRILRFQSAGRPCLGSPHLR